MAPKLAEAEATEVVKILGRHFPNLVLIWDSEESKKPEFRVQLEVELDTETARKVAEALWGHNTRTSGRINEAKDLVLERVPDQASDTFKDIVQRAFDDQPQHKGSRQLKTR